MMYDNNESSWAVSRRIAQSAFYRVSIREHASAIGVGMAAVFGLAGLEGSLHLKPSSSKLWLVKARFVARYALYNVVPSLIWATQQPSTIVSSSSYLASRMKPTSQWLYSTNSAQSSNSLPSKRLLWIRNLCALRGAVAGSVVLSNVIVLTSLWERAREEYHERIRLGKEPPLENTTSGRTIRLAGAGSDVTQLALKTRGPLQIWPIYEETREMQQYPSSIPIYWQIDNRGYSQASCWLGMKVPRQWLFDVSNQETKMLYLEADATNGGASALSLQHGAYYFDERDNDGESGDSSKTTTTRTTNNASLAQRWGLTYDNGSFSKLDLDLKEVAQGFFRLTDLARRETKSRFEVCRVLLVDPSVVIESGGGRQTTVREHVQELGLADVIIDARATVLSAMLKWLDSVSENENSKRGRRATLRPVILETPSKQWFHSIRSELRKHGYNVVDRVDAPPDRDIPMFVYEHSSADTVHSIRQYLERGILQDASKVCALLPFYDGLEEIKALNDSLDGASGEACVGYVCSSEIHERTFEWVRKKSLQGVAPKDIQKELDEGV